MTHQAPARRTLPLPETGQLVEVRRRRWVASETSDSSLPAGGIAPHRLVTLASLEDDALGEELQVIWQLEPGARVIERAGLPVISGCDSDDRLEAFLDAVRWGVVTNVSRADLQAPFRSGISIEDYQLDPLVRAIDMARVNLLIADDVGLGKTIEAGLVIQEMLVRHRARTVLIVCPASVQVKWQTEMQEKFGLEFRIVDTDYLRQQRRSKGIHVNPWTSFPRLITSMDWAKAGEGLRFLKDVLPPGQPYPRKFDILVVDEAHNVAPAGGAQYAVESQRTRLIRLVAPHFQHRLFLTATPHNGYQESFTSLLELLDDQRFARTILPDEDQLHRVMVRRLKGDITDADGNPVFPRRELRKLPIKYTTDEQEAHQLLQQYVKLRGRATGGARQIGADFTHKLLKKRLFSSPMAFASTLEKYCDTLSGVRVVAAPNVLDEGILRKAILRTEEEQASDSHLEEAETEAVAAAGVVADPLTNEQQHLLNELSSWAGKARNRPDSKAEAILEWIEEHLKTGGAWNEKRVILFTEYRATHSWLQQILAANGLGGERLMYLHGAMLPDEREAVKAAFQADPRVSPVRILLATDAASEGIDLQNHCNYLIHVEIPWNPNVMEQRNGRIDRHGQRQEEVLIWHPVGTYGETGSQGLNSAAGDHEYLLKAALKVDSIRQDLGSVGSVLAKQIEDAMLGRGFRLDVSASDARTASARRQIAGERRLRERIAALHQRLLDAQKDAHLSPAHLVRAVNVGLELAAKPPLTATGLPGAPSGSVFHVPNLTGSWSKATVGLWHPHTHERRPITFDHAVAQGRDDVVLAHLNHPLVQLSLRLLREEIWKLDDIKQLHRVAVRTVPDHLLDAPAVTVRSRLVITGGDHRRLHEELTLAGGMLAHDRFTRITQIGRLTDLGSLGKATAPSERLLATLRERFERHQESIMAAVDTRSRERLQHLSNTIGQRMEAALADVEAILDDLEAGIRRQLDPNADGGQAYLPGMSPEEIAQVNKDVTALEERLLRIPGERAQETETIRRQYADPQARTFPVAVVFHIPESLMGAR